MQASSTKNDSSSNSTNLMTRLNATKNLMTQGLNAKSADDVRLNMEKAFSGSVKSDNSMIYKNNVLELDKMKAGVMYLKLADNKVLKAPDISAFEIEKNTVGGDKTKELLDSLKKDISQSVINAIGNELNHGMGSPMGGEALISALIQKQKQKLITKLYKKKFINRSLLLMKKFRQHFSHVV